MANPNDIYFSLDNGNDGGDGDGGDDPKNQKNESSSSYVVVKSRRKKKKSSSVVQSLIRRLTPKKKNKVGDAFESSSTKKPPMSGFFPKKEKVMPAVVPKLECPLSLDEFKKIYGMDWDELSDFQKRSVISSHRVGIIKEPINYGSGFDQHQLVNIEPLSKARHSRLQNGHAVRVRLSKTRGTAINVTPVQMKKLLRADKNGTAYTITLDKSQQIEHKKQRMKGGSIVRSRSDTQQRAMYNQSFIPIQSIQPSSEYDMEGEGFKDMVRKFKEKKIGKKIVRVVKTIAKNPIVKKVGQALVERAIKTIAGGGRPRVKLVKHRPTNGEGIKDFTRMLKRKHVGRKFVNTVKKVAKNPLVKKVGQALVERAIKSIAGGSGGSLYPAGIKRGGASGGALYPAGSMIKRGGALFPA
jgi:hypothetical protein